MSLKVFLSPLRCFLSDENYLKYRAACRDCYNYYIIGRKAPKYAERVYINPMDVTNRITNNAAPGFADSAKVITGSWPYDKQKPINTGPTMIAMVRRFRDGLSWEESGYVDIMKKRISSGFIIDGIDSESSINRRCEALDKMYHQVKSEKALAPSSEINKDNFRECDGVMISISDTGELVKTGGGNHRLMIAQILELPVIPAQIGVVHVKSIHKLAGLRTPRISH